jgi:4-amino-4-deoxy-L-arabinose transferase
LYETPVLPFNYTDWGNNNIWLHKQPLALWLIAVSLKIFGIHAWAVRVPSVICSTICIKLTYDIAGHLYDRRTAFIAAFLFSIHGFIIELASGLGATDHIDTIFLFFILLGIWYAVKYSEQGSGRYLILIGVCMGAAILSKWLPALIILPVWFLLEYQKCSWKATVMNALIIIFFAALIAVPWQVYILHAFPAEAKWEYSFDHRHLFEVIEGHAGNKRYHFNMLRIIYGELIYLPVLWFIYKTIRDKSNSDIIIGVWFGLPYLIFSMAATKMPAYTVIAAPAIFIITANAFTEWRSYIPEKKWKGKVLTIVTYGLILLPVRYSIERIKPFTVVDDDPQWMKRIDDIRNSELNDPKTIIFNFDHPVEMMFYTDCICYEVTPDEAMVEKIDLNKYKILILSH